MFYIFYTSVVVIPNVPLKLNGYTSFIFHSKGFINFQVINRSKIQQQLILVYNFTVYDERNNKNRFSFRRWGKFSIFTTIFMYDTVRLYVHKLSWKLSTTQLIFVCHLKTLIYIFGSYHLCLFYDIC